MLALACGGAAPGRATRPDRHGYTLAFTISAALLGLGVILAILTLPSRHQLEELSSGATVIAAPQPARR